MSDLSFSSLEQEKDYYENKDFYEGLVEASKRSNELDEIRRALREPSKIYYASVKIVDAHTFKTYFSGTIGPVYGENTVKERLRKELGFPEESDIRTVGNITQRIMWQKIFLDPEAIKRAKQYVKEEQQRDKEETKFFKDLLKLYE